MNGTSMGTLGLDWRITLRPSELVDRLRYPFWRIACGIRPTMVPGDDGLGDDGDGV